MMTTVQPKAQCPQCGGPLALRASTVSCVCEYCGSTIVRTDVDLASLGKMSELVDTGSPILLGSRGRWQRDSFQVVGRLQVEYARGRWNEWFLEFAGGKAGWLTDAMGSFALVLPLRPPSEPLEFRELYVGYRSQLFGKSLQVTDRREAKYLGAEGMLPFEAQRGSVFRSVDLRGENGEFFTLDFGEQSHSSQLLAYGGRSLTLTDLHLDRLRDFEGWQRPT